MVNIKYAFLGLSRKTVFTLIAILQLAVSFTFLYNLIYIKYQVASTTDKVTLTFNKPNMYIIEPFYNVDDIMQKKDGNFMKFYEYLKNNKKIEHCTAYEDHLLINRFNGYEKFLLTNNYAPIKDGKTYFPIKTLKVDYNYIKSFNYKVIEGKSFTEDDFADTRNNVPILLGYNYKNIFKINDKIEYYDYKKGKMTLFVKGFIDKGYNYVGTNINHENIHNLDSYIIFPLNPPKIINAADITGKFDAANGILQSYTIINSDDKETCINEIKNTAKQYFGDVKLTSINSKMNKYIEQYKIEEAIVTTMFLVIFIMCSIGIITNMIDSIKNRYKEFGIHLLNGASMKDIYYRIFFEMFIITVSSLSVSICGINILKLFKFLEINYIFFEQLMLLAFFLMLIILIYPILFIKRLSLNQLLRRE